MSRINNSYYAILGLLAFQPMSGYGIKMCVDKGVGYFWEIDYKQIYPTLKKMFTEGHVIYELEKNINRPVSKVYSITEAGLAELRNWLNEPISSGKYSDNELKLKLFFGHHISIEKNIEHLQNFKEMNIKSLENIYKIQKIVYTENENLNSMHYRMTTVMNGELMYKANIDWCNKAIEYLQNNIHNY